jgi:Arc/MetJ family transcription regulator
MRTTLDLNESLVSEAMRWTGESTKTGAINEALKQIVKFRKRLRLIELAGKVKLDIDIDATRERRQQR